jgi:hypothetical protein
VLDDRSENAVHVEEQRRLLGRGGQGGEGVHPA